MSNANHHVIGASCLFFCTTIISELDAAAYDQIAQQLEPLLRTAPGFVSHAAYPAPPGWTISEIWDSELHAGPMTQRVLEDGTSTEHRLGLVEITIPPGVDGPPQHIHRSHDETFYVISGAPTFTCATDVTTAAVGTLVAAPPGTPHTFGNPGDVPAVILCTVTPDRYIDYFRELDQLPRSPTGLDHVAVAEIMRQYETETFRP